MENNTPTIRNTRTVTVAGDTYHIIEMTAPARTPIAAYNTIAATIGTIIEPAKRTSSRAIGGLVRYEAIVAA